MAQSSKNYYHMGTIYVHDKIDMQNSRLAVGEPINSNDAATKNYVDTRITVAGLDPGIGLYQTGNTFNVSNSLGNVTALGTINTGTWTASSIQVPYGGTGKINFASNKIIIGNGSNPLVSVNELSFDTNIFTIDSTVKISNSSISTSFTSGGALTIQGGTSILGKLWVNNDVNIKGDVTLGNLVINGSTDFSTINANASVFTNMTTNNLFVNTSLTSLNISTTNLVNVTNSTITNIQSSNITTSNFNTTNITSSNLIITNLSNLNHLNVTNTTTFNLIAAVTTSANQVSINITTGSFIATNESITNSTITSLFSPTLRSTNFVTTNITSNNLFINSNSILSTASINNLISTNNTTTNILTTNITTSNIITSTAILTNSSTIPNLLTTNLITTNITTTNLSLTNSLHQNTTTNNLNVPGITILSTVNSNHITTASIITTNSTISNNITTNTTISNSIISNSLITSLTNSNLISNNITSSNLRITGITILNTLGSSNLTTGELSVSNISNLNQLITINSSMSNLNISNISILNTVVSSNLSSGSIQTTNLIANSTLLTNIRSTNITTTNIRTTSLNATGITTLSTVSSFNLSTGTLFVSDLSSLNQLTTTNSTITNIINNTSTIGNIHVNSNIKLEKSLQIGSNFSGSPSISSGNLLTILPSIYTDNVSNTSDTIPLWTPIYISNPTLTSQNTISTEKVSTIYIQGNPITGINQTITHSSALSIGYVGNETSGNLKGQIMLERQDGNWYGSIYTESGTNRIVMCNASLAGGSGLGLYTYTNTPIIFAHIPSATSVTPSNFAQFTRTTSNFYSTENSTNTSSGAVVISGGLGVNKNITCNSLALPNIFTSEPQENDTVIIPETTSVVILKPTNNLNTINLTLPDNPINGQILHITSLYNITTINLSNGNLGSISLPPTNITRHTPLRLIYYFTDNAWFLI